MGADYKHANRSIFEFATENNVAGNTTTEIGVDHNQANWAGVAIPIPVDGILELLHAASEAAPGAGETYTYTVYINGAPVALTCQIAGAAAVQASDLVNNVAVAQGDRVHIHLVTSLNSGAAQHMVTLVIRH